MFRNRHLSRLDLHRWNPNARKSLPEPNLSFSHCLNNRAPEKGCWRRPSAVPCPLLLPKVPRLPSDLMWERPIARLNGSRRIDSQVKQ